MSDKASILIVDDRPEKVLALEAVLEDLGQNIVRAFSGREALRYVLQQDFAAILLDVNMPGMDGFETASLIRQRKNSQHTPILFITAFGDEMHAARGYQLGAVDYILAPVLPDVLRTKVAVFVDLFRKSQQLKQQTESLSRRATQLQKLSAASVAINGASSMERMLQNITETARDIVGAHQAITLYILDGAMNASEAHKTRTLTSFSDKYAAWRGRTLSLDRCAQTRIGQSLTPIRLLEAELHDHPDWQVVGPLVETGELPPIRGMMAAPLLGGDGRRLGIVYLSDKYDGAFTPDDEAILVQLTQMASIAIENWIYSQERETNRLKDEFLATLSHELRTPLTAILGWTQLLRSQSDDEGQTAHGLEVIERNVKAQAKLIEDLLDVSRITTGKLRLSVSALTLGPILDAAIDAVRPAAEGKNITIETHFDSTEQVLWGDPDRLQQVVWNLLSNAVKFTPPGGRIRATLARENRCMRIEVTDTGAGIPESFLPYVFDRFRQADSSSTRSAGGLGIGLTIVRHIIELHGGTVHAHSNGEGQGSTFTVYLPIQTAPTAPHSDHGDGELRGRLSNPNASLRGLRVLVVEDDEDTRELLITVLQRASATVESAGSAKEGLERFGQFRPDVLLSDLAMPGEDGYWLIRHVRNLSPEQGGQTPAIAVTAYAREEDRTRVLKAGFQTHISKPVQPAELVGSLVQFVAPAAVTVNGSAPQQPTCTTEENPLKPCPA